VGPTIHPQHPGKRWWIPKGGSWPVIGTSRDGSTSGAATLDTIGYRPSNLVRECFLGHSSQNACCRARTTAERRRPCLFWNAPAYADSYTCTRPRVPSTQPATYVSEQPPIGISIERRSWYLKGLHMYPGEQGDVRLEPANDAPSRAKAFRRTTHAGRMQRFDSKRSSLG
jgi:hypothetical protein